MDLKQDFLSALESGKGPAFLLELARRRQADGATPEKCYQVLEQIWLDHGFDDSEKESPLRNDLEFIMEKLWYQESSAT